MKKTFFIFSLFLFPMTAMAASDNDNLFSEPKQRTENPNKILVQYKEDITLPNGETAPKFDTVNVKNPDRFNRKLKQLRKRDDVLRAAPNYTRDILEVTNDDPLDQYYMDLDQASSIDASKAWSVKKGVKKIKIAVIDTGVDITHPDLKDNIWTNSDEELNGKDDDGNGVVDDIHGWDFSEDDNDIMPRSDCDTTTPSHGTHVAGIAAGRTNNTQGIAGVAWRSKIMPIKVSDDCDGTMTDGDIVNGILYAAQNGADVINLSLGGLGKSSIIDDAVQTATEEFGVAIIAASGNNSINLNRIPFYPVCAEGVIGVSATNAEDNAALFSNYGEECVDVAAPGVDILSTVANGEYAEFSGTSMATPVVSGVVALLQSQEKDLKPNEVLTILRDTAEDIGMSSQYGTGRINAVDAMLALDSVQPVHIRGFKNDDKDKEYFSGETKSDQTPYFEWKVPKLLNEDVAGYYVYVGKNKEADPVQDGTFKDKPKKKYTKDNKLKGGNNVTYYVKVAVKKTDGSIYSQKGNFKYIVDTE